MFHAELFLAVAQDLLVNSVLIRTGVFLTIPGNFIKTGNHLRLPYSLALATCTASLPAIHTVARRLREPLSNSLGTKHAKILMLPQ